MAPKRVLLVALGGTIAMSQSANGGIVPALSGADLVAAVPGLAELAEVEPRSPFQLPGASLTLEHLCEVARLIDAGLMEGFSGAIVVQGTDTIEETAFVLDCLVQSRKPVVVTGAMRGPQSAGADGPANLLASAMAAISTDLQDAGVVVVLNDEIHAARFVRKGHTGLTSAFVSSPLGPIGHVFEGKVRLHAKIAPMTKLPNLPEGEKPAVALLVTGLGDDGRLIDKVIDLGYQGAVIAGVGAGHTPAVLAEKVERLAASMPVVLASRVTAGPVFEKTYGFAGSEIDLIARGVIPSGEIGAAKARLLLQLLLAHGKSVSEIRYAFAAL